MEPQHQHQIPSDHGADESAPLRMPRTRRYNVVQRCDGTWAVEPTTPVELPAAPAQSQMHGGTDRIERAPSPTDGGASPAPQVG